VKFPFDQEIELEDSVALLRPLGIKDVEQLLPVASREEDLLQYSPKPVYNHSLLREYVVNAIHGREMGARYSFSVFDKVRNAYAGSTSFLNIANVDDRLEIGATWYGKEFQRTGLNRHCKYLMLQFAFESLGAVRVEFRTDERNLASRRAIEGIGAKFEGIFRKHTLMYDGYRRNTVCYSILKEEWQSMKSGFPIRRS
jgi:N-acetyltransferase